MVPAVIEKPRVTEIKVRMDCNGCVQKVKKALHGIMGIYEIYIDFPEQKITIIGWADPVKIVKAIKKTRKTAVICSHTEQFEPPAEQEPEGGEPEGGAPPPESDNAQTEQLQTEAAPPEDGHKEEQPPLPDNPPPPPEEKPLPESATNEAAGHPIQPSRPKDLEEIHVIYHHPPDYGYRYAYGHYHQAGNGAQWNTYPSGPGIRPEQPQPAQPIYATHGYNTYHPSAYVTEYAYPSATPGYPQYSRPELYSQANYSNNSNDSITSMFSEENPNACSIV